MTQSAKTSPSKRLPLPPVPKPKTNYNAATSTGVLSGFPTPPWGLKSYTNGNGSRSKQQTPHVPASPGVGQMQGKSNGKSRSASRSRSRSKSGSKRARSAGRSRSAPRNPDGTYKKTRSLAVTTTTPLTRLSPLRRKRTTAKKGYASDAGVTKITELARRRRRKSKSSSKSRSRSSKSKSRSSSGRRRRRRAPATKKKSRGFLGGIFGFSQPTDRNYIASLRPVPVAVPARNTWVAK